MIIVLFTQQDLALNMTDLREFENCTPINLHVYVTSSEALAGYSDLIYFCIDHHINT
jgi:hypothetical protein